MKHISIKKLEKISLQLAHAIVEVRSWSVILSYNLNKKKDYKLSDLYEEAQKIEDFGKQLQDTIKLRIEVVNEHTSSQDK
jgi:RNase H-fold protein (predicted Holliday junction resolvase)